MSDSDLSEGIVPDDLPRHILPPTALRADFKPWHRVRKQFVRERQWNHEIRFLAQRYLRRELQTDETEWAEAPSAEADATIDSTPEVLRIERPLSCLVLPGEDLLDIRSLWQELQREGYYLRFLGFNNTIGTHERRRQMDVAECAITQLTKVCKNSHVTCDSFQAIARTTTQAYHLFRKYGPYDVVNLDLCDSLVPRGKEGEMQANYTALHQLVFYQLQRQRTPWLLFATTQVDRDSASQSEINQLARPIRDNCDKHPRFCGELARLIPEAAFRNGDHTLDISQLSADHLVRVFGVVLGKWLMNALAQASPRCGVKLLPSYRYTIKPESSVDMLSLGFLITPFYAPPVDVTGVSALQPTVRQFPCELDSALGFVSMASDIRNVDELLEANSAMHEQLANSKADLLAAAGYDRDAYLRWVADGERETVN